MKITAKVVDTDKQFHLHFRHYEDEVEDGRIHTECAVHLGECKRQKVDVAGTTFMICTTASAIGASSCSPLDVFDKRVGRANALQRALAQEIPELGRPLRGLRTAIWEQYRAIAQIPKSKGALLRCKNRKQAVSSQSGPISTATSPSQ